MHGCSYSRRSKFINAARILRVRDKSYSVFRWQNGSHASSRPHLEAAPILVVGDAPAVVALARAVLERIEGHRL
eukprot:1619327-Pleurochrysis_carterae.AAC.1